MRKIITELKANVNLKSNDGFLALHVAVVHNHVNMIEFLIGECQADSTVVFDSSGFNLLHLAALTNAFSSIYCLIDLGVGRVCIFITQHSFYFIFD